jgi:hypothetical protein
MSTVKSRYQKTIDEGTAGAVVICELSKLLVAL